MGIKLIVGAVVVAAPMLLGACQCQKAHADTRDEVCGAFNLGVPPDQIAQGLQRNDARENPWKAQRDTVWPIIEGDCG